MSSISLCFPRPRSAAAAGYIRAWLISLAVIVAAPGAALAGMPSVGFSEAAQLRLEAISFFLLRLLLSAAAVRLAWNWLRKDFPLWPRLAHAPLAV